MSEEKRKYPRKGFNSAVDECSFYLEEKGRLYEINDVQDVSISGVGVHLPKKFNIGQKIVLKYESPDYHLSIDGTIAWCDNAVQPGSSRLGIEFDAGNQEDNSLFFLAVRKFLDPFNGVPLKSH